MCQRDIPGSVSADRVPRQKHAGRINCKPPAGVAQAAQNGRMLAGGRLVLARIRLGPIERNDDIPVPGSLTLALSFGADTAIPPIDLQRRVASAAVQW